MRLCLERLCPPRRDRLVTISLPKVETVRDAAQAHAAILDAVAAGEITPAEGGEMTRRLEAFSRTLEVAELEERPRALEQRVKQ